MKNRKRGTGNEEQEAASAAGHSPFPVPCFSFFIVFVRSGRRASKGCWPLAPRLCLGADCLRGSASRITLTGGRASRAVRSQAEPGNERIIRAERGNQVQFPVLSPAIFLYAA